MPPTLRLTVDTERPVRADNAARVFEKLPVALNAYLARRGERQVELWLTHLRVGSLIADFTAVAAGVVLTWEFRGALIGFLGELRQTYSKLTNRKLKPVVEGSNERLIKALEELMAVNGAQEISLDVRGVNDISFVMRRGDPQGRPRPEPNSVKREAPAVVFSDALLLAGDIEEPDSVKHQLRSFDPHVNLQIELRDGHPMVVTVTEDAAKADMRVQTLLPQDFELWVARNLDRLIVLVVDKIGDTRPDFVRVEASDIRSDAG